MSERVSSLATNSSEPEPGARVISRQNVVPLGWALRFALARMRAGWRSRVTVIASIVLIAVIGALSPLYTALVTQNGMVQRLETQPSASVNLFTRFGITAASTDVREAWTDLDATIRDASQAQFDLVSPGWLDQTLLWAESAPMFVVLDEDIPGLKLRAAHYQGWDSQVDMLEGTLTPTDGADVSAAITADIANRFDLSVGDVITLDQRGWETSQPFTVGITAIVAPADPDAAYWMAPSPLRVDRTQNGVEANVFVTMPALEQILQTYTPQASAAMGWRFLLDHNRLPYSQLSAASAQIAALQADLEQRLEEELGYSLTFTTALPDVLTRYAAEINLLNAPFGVLMLQVGALVLFFLLITAALAQRSERPELAMLQNRGALEGQILLLRALEAALICAAAALVSPFIAQHALILAAPLLTGRSELALELTLQPFLYAGFMVLWALAVLLITLRPVLRLPLISAGGAAVRAGKQTWWQRYYLDLLLVVVGTIALFRLLSTNTPFAQSLFGGLQADPLLLIAPALLFLALGSITLRVFPSLTTAISRSLAERRALEGALATWSVSRDPAHYARLTFLLALAIGIGWFAISFQATLERSHIDRAQYETGADVRLVEQDTQTDTIRPEPAEAYTALDGVRAAAEAYRLTDLNLSLDGLSIERGNLLAVNTESFAEAAFWRDDLGELALPSAPDQREQGVTLPAETQALRVRMRLHEILIDVQTGEQTIGTPQINTLFSEILVFARLRSSDGTYSEIQLIPREVDGVDDLDNLWQFNLLVSPFAPIDQIEAEQERLAAALEGVSGWITFEAQTDEPIAADTVLDTLFWRTNLRSMWSPFAPRQLEIVDLWALDAGGEVLTDDLLNRPDWSLTIDNAAVMNQSELTPHITEPEGGWSIFWIQTQERSVFGLGLNPQPSAIPAIVSTPYAIRNALDTGAVFDLYIDSRPYAFVVAGTADHFPTLFADQAPFVVVDLNALMYSLNQRPGAAYYPNEVLLDLEDGISPAEWVQERAQTASGRTVVSALTAEQVREQFADDVLMLGLSRLLLIAFIISLVLSVFSLLAYAALNAQNRRDQFAVLRALGMSSRRIAFSAAIEQAIVFLVAAFLGTIMGALLSGQVLPTLGISRDGGALTPPFIVQIDGLAVIQYAAVLIALLLLVLAVTAAIIRRMSLSQALRYREE